MENPADKPASIVSRELFQLLNIEIEPSLRLTISKLEHSDRQWSFNLCRAVEHLWYLGALKRNVRADLMAILEYLKWESEDADAGRVTRSEQELQVIWETIAVVYLKISELK